MYVSIVYLRQAWCAIKLHLFVDSLLLIREGEDEVTSKNVPAERGSR